MEKVIGLVHNLLETLDRKICERRMKLLEAEAKHKPRKIRKHEKKLMDLYLEQREVKDKINRG